jgi:putative ABC transport system permease protein
LAAQNVSGILGLGSDRVVLGAGVAEASPTYADSTITAEQSKSWAEVPGVNTVTALGLSQTRAESDDGRIAVAIFATADGALGAPTTNSEIALSAPAADQLDVAVGDTVTIVDTAFTVTAIEGQDWYSHTPVVRTTLHDWQSMQARMGASVDTVTALLITGDADWSAADAAAGTTSQSVLGSLTLLPAFRSEIGSLLLIVALLFGISALVIGAFFTVWTMQRRGDVAILKALGATNGALVRDALGQALVVLVAGTVVGSAIVIAAGLAISGSLPFLMSPWTTLAPAVLLIAVGLIGAAFALRTVTTSDPLTALGSNR